MFLGSADSRSRLALVFFPVLSEKPILALFLREREEQQGRAQQDRDDAGEVGPLVALEERRLRGGYDLVGVLRVTFMLS